MYFSHLNLYNFKNYDERRFEFCASINCLLGENGVGKTNVLDALYYLSMTKSYHSSNEQDNILHGMPGFMISGKIHDEAGMVMIVAGVQAGKKSFKVNKVAYEKNSEHIGKYPLVILTPNDTDLIREGSEERRRFYNMLLSQTNPTYLASLIKYNQALKRRNAILKAQLNHQPVDFTVLSYFDEILSEEGTYIHAQRLEAEKEFNPDFLKAYGLLTGEKEIVSAIYTSTLTDESLRDALSRSQGKDIATMRTNVGIHKDDYKFCIAEKPIKKFGSQGQQKSFVIALKLAQYFHMKRVLGIRPVILLDDIFDKLDDNRIANLVNMLDGEGFGQVFITDARPERSKGLLANAKRETSFIEIG